VADWIGSNEDYFKFSHDISPNDYIQISQNRAREALTELGWLPPVNPAKPAEFDSIFPFQPYPVQDQVVGLSRNQKGQDLTIIETEMGSGKTEAALYASDKHFCENRSKGFYIALPTQATSNAMHERVRKDYLGKRGHTGNLNLQLVHSGAYLSNVVSEKSQEDTSVAEGANLEAQPWFKGSKRPLLAPFGIGTIDQCLLSVLRTRHWFVRLFGLSNKTVIFDEVHAYDAYTSTLLENLLSWLAASGCSVVILSATLPKQRTRSLLKAYTGEEEVPCLDHATYPRIIHAGADGISLFPVPRGETPKAVRLEIIPSIPERLPTLIRERLLHGGCAAVVCNTVKRAQDVYHALRGNLGDCELHLFHARTPFAWRRQQEKEILRKYGKPDTSGNSPSRPHRAVIVATQVIEQSLDLDFDWMISDLAPVDLLLQRLGRMHRHNRPRPQGHESPVFTIMADLEKPAGIPCLETSGVYEDYVVLRSWLALMPFIESGKPIVLPDDIDHLVQNAYSDEDPSISDDHWQAVLDSYRRAYKHKLAEDKNKAKNILIPPPEEAHRIFTFESSDHYEDDDPRAHESIRAATRLGQPSVSVVCLIKENGRILDAVEKRPVSLEDQPGPNEIRRLLYSTVSLSSRHLFHILKKQEPPACWRKTRLLRFHRELVFEEGEASLDSWRVFLNQELGIYWMKGE